jgi:hypothetical protein
MEEYKLWGYENRVLRRIFGLKRGIEWKKNCMREFIICTLH